MTLTTKSLGNEANRMNMQPRDPAALILSLMADGRERTATDISLRIRIPVAAIQPTLTTMAKLGYLQSEKTRQQKGQISIYRKPQA